MSRYILTFTDPKDGDDMLWYAMCPSLPEDCFTTKGYTLQMDAIEACAQQVATVENRARQQDDKLPPDFLKRGCHIRVVVS